MDQRQFYAHNELGMVKLEVGQEVVLKTLTARDKSHYENVVATITSFTPTNNFTSEGTFKVVTHHEFEMIHTDFVTGEKYSRKENLVIPTNVGSIKKESFKLVSEWQPIGGKGTDFMYTLPNGKAMVIKRISPINSFEEYEMTYPDGTRETVAWSLTAVVEHLMEKVEESNA